MSKQLLKHLTYLILITSPLISVSQSFGFGTIVADLGTGGGIYGIKGYSPVNKSTQSGIAAVGTLPRFNAEFGLLKFFGAGISYRRGTYGKKGDDKLRGSDILFRANIHLARSNDNFDLPIGVGFGFSSFGGSINSTQSIKTNGSLLNVHVSPHFWFGNHVGMFLSLSYNQNINKKVTLVDGSKVYTEADGATWNMTGVLFEFGISGKLHLKNISDNPLDKKH